MKRFLLKELETWKTASLRKPLVLRGARQVGKSWLIDEFGRQFDSYVKINFEKQPEVASFFADELDVPTLIEKLSVLTHQKIIPGKTLLFFDEIQECQRALLALRYFKEECPELHVVAAGSLIDFALDSIGIPVGRVQFLYLYPLSFSEFLVALDREDLLQYINKFTFDIPIHKQLLELVKTYFWLGGMPAVIDAWLQTKDINTVQDVQDELVLAYKQDFHKYAKQHQMPRVDKIFVETPKQLGQKFVYSRVDVDSRIEPLRNAFMLLMKAGIIYKVCHSSAQGLPLASSSNERRFKAFFFDIGLAQRLSKLNVRDWLMQPLEVKYLGGIAEQFVAQEYIAYTSIKKPAELYYWHREKPTSNAEVDFLFVKDSQIIPVEVKAGKHGTLKSMQLFLQSHPNSPFGLKISENSFSMKQPIHGIPFYAISAWLTTNIQRSRDR